MNKIEELLIGQTIELARFKIIELRREREYWKSRCEATDNESLLGSKYLAYPTKENKSAWMDALSKLDAIKMAEPK